MTTFTFPSSLTPNASTWGLTSNTRALVSPVSGAAQAIVRGGERWICTLTFNNLLPAERAELVAFLARLNGHEHRVLLEDHSWTRQGTGAEGAESTAATAAGATQITFDGAPASQTGYIKAGDYVQIRGEMKMAVADVDTDGSGEGTLLFVPRVRDQIPIDEPLNLIAPLRGTFMLADPTVSWSNRPGVFTNLSVSFIEDVLA